MVKSHTIRSQYGNRYDHCRYEPPKMADSRNGKGHGVLFADMVMVIIEAMTLIRVIVNIMYQCQQQSPTAYTRNVSKETS